MASFKNVFLGKNVLHGQGMWAYTVFIDGVAVGFLEFTRPYGFHSHDGVYLNADFAVAGTPYKRLSKLIVMLAVCGDTRRVLERAREIRLRLVTTTAFTKHAVSMKYRGVMELKKRGETPDGQKFLNYVAEFNGDSWQEVLVKWLAKHSSIRS